MDESPPVVWYGCYWITIYPVDRSPVWIPVCMVTRQEAERWAELYAMPYGLGSWRDPVWSLTAIDAVHRCVLTPLQAAGVWGE